MKKIFSLIVAASISLGMMAATEFTFTDAASVNQNANGFSVKIVKAEGSNDPTYNNGLRLYAKNTITIAGTGITRIELTFTKQGSKAYADLSAPTGIGTLASGGESTSNEDKKTDVWTGSASSVTFTLGETGQRIITRVVINRADGEVLPGDEGGTSIDPEQPKDTLNPAYTYAEPTEVHVTDETTGNNMAYSFVKNNIRIDCSMGAITENYFGCNANNTITFTATQAIKGLTIKGFVKKDFTATVDNGDVSFMSPSSQDGATGDPVMVITDIDAKSVTISCVKQLRCYSVMFYFVANPTDTVEGGTNGEGETYSLTFDSADAVYESEYSTEGDYNYTVYLYNADSEVPYIGLDLYTATMGDLLGTHDPGEYSFYQFGANEDDYTMNVDGAVAITQEGNVYTISGYLTGDDNNIYNFTFTGEMEFYTDEEYYSGGDEAIEAIYPPLDRMAPMYDLLGRPIDKDYHGIVIQNGNKYLVR